VSSTNDAANDPASMRPIEGTTGARPGSARSGRRPGFGPLAIAGFASLGAGAIHATAVGSHSEHHAAMYVFIATAIFQLAWGAWALQRSDRTIAWLGALGNAACLGGWLAAKVSGLSFINGLQDAERVQLADGAAAALALVAVVPVLWVTAAGFRRRRPRAVQSWLIVASAVVVVGLTMPSMVSAANHVHTHSHTHGVAAPATGTTGTTVAGDGHVHDANGNDVVGGAPINLTSVPDPSATTTATTAHQHTTAAVATKPYDPTMPIDLGGVDGVTPQEQARAENLVAITIIRLPQFADPAAAEAEGYHSIHDGLTGFEHYINWSYMNDQYTLDPDHPESLVYQVTGNTKKLVSAMFMLAPTVKLADVPDIGGKLTQWHIHDNLCFTADPVAPVVAGVTSSGGTCPAPLVHLASAPMIHVWIVPHKCGPFAALEGVGAGQIEAGQTRLCDTAHGSGTF
jgi:hypothetical protein